VRALALAGLFAGFAVVLGVLYVVIRLLAAWLAARREERAPRADDDFPHVDTFTDERPPLTLIRGGKGRGGVDRYRAAYRGRN